MAKDSLTNLVETERLLAVKQIVDKLSTFIGRIAQDVEGGIRYFNEMAYFVSIHDRQLNLVAANRTYRSLLGKKPGNSSWEIYCGEFNSPHTCPVGKTLTSGNVQKNTEAKYRWIQPVGMDPPFASCFRGDLRNH